MFAFSPALRPVDPRDAVTTLLSTGLPSGADPDADASLYALVYDELRALAQRRVRAEPAGRTIGATDLVHEAYLRLADAPRVASQGRAYFFASAARAMRNVLVDAARRRGALRRGGGAGALRLDSGPLSRVLPAGAADADGFAADLLDLDDALADLAARNARAARVVECRYFGGLTVEETALALGVSERTVKGDWALARAFLFRALGDAADAPSGDSAAPGGG